MIRAKKQLFAVLALLLFALGAWLLRERSSESASVTPERAASAAVPDRDLEARDSLAAEARSGVPAVQEPDRTASAQAKAFVVRGRCVDRDLHPIADADVELTELMRVDPVSGQWKDMLASANPATASFPCVRTTSDGRFAVTASRPEWVERGSIVTVVARKHGHSRASARKAGDDGAEFDVGDLVLGPGARVRGLVRDVVGNRCSGVQLMIGQRPAAGFGSWIASDSATSDANGTFVLENAPAALCELSAKADDLRKATQELDLSSGEPRLDVEVVLPELDGMDSISGTVVDPEGRAVPRAWLLERTTSGPEPALRQITACDDHGRFRIDGRPDSVFEILAWDREARWCGVRASDLRSGAHGVELRLDGTRTFLLRVRDPSGTPIERFGYDRRSHLIFQGASRNEVLHNGGELPLPSDIGPFSLRVFAPGYASCDLDPLDPATMPAIIDAVLARACTLRGVVRSGNAGIAKARVGLAESQIETTTGPPSFLGARPEPSATSDAEGRFELTVEGAGTVRLQAQRREEVSAPTDPINVRAGRDVEGIVIELVAAGQVEGRVLRFDGKPGAALTVSVSRSGKVLRSVRADEQGSYRVLDLAHGRYDLVVFASHGAMQFDSKGPARDGDRQRWSFEVQAGRTTQLDLQLLEPVRLRVALDLPSVPRVRWRMELHSWTAGSSGLDLDERETQGRDAFELEFVDPIDAAVELGCDVPGWPRIHVPRRAFERGAHEIALALRSGRIEGVLALPVAAGEEVRLEWRDAASSAHAVVAPDAQGRFVFECAPMGECVLSLKSRPGVSRAIAVNAGETCRVDGF